MASRAEIAANNALAEQEGNIAPLRSLRDLLIQGTRYKLGNFGPGTQGIPGTPQNNPFMPSNEFTTGARTLFSGGPGADEAISRQGQNARTNIIENTPLRGGPMDWALARAGEDEARNRLNVSQQGYQQALSVLQELGGAPLNALQQGAVNSQLSATPLRSNQISSGSSSGIGGFLGGLLGLGTGGGNTVGGQLLGSLAGLFG